MDYLAQDLPAIVTVTTLAWCVGSTLLEVVFVPLAAVFRAFVD